jgi:hypothetical protein
MRDRETGTMEVGTAEYVFNPSDSYAACVCTHEAELRAPYVPLQNSDLHGQKYPPSLAI